ncbi:hypothetical protein Ndes2526B_g08413 [Nannochloris sp. 'desiccata']|nr:hypothetical protein NADE_001139 [Chlorella desiccata (nom. nud.)]
MNVAPKRYDEEFYRRELDGQEKRLNVLKSRQENRRERFARHVKKPDATAAKTSNPPRSQDRETSSLETVVLRALKDSTLELPCSLDVFVGSLENKPHHGDVAAILRSRCRKQQNMDKVDDGTVSVELENADNTRKMIITAVHRINKDETQSKRHRKE